MLQWEGGTEVSITFVRLLREQEQMVTDEILCELLIVINKIVINKIVINNEHMLRLSDSLWMLLCGCCYGNVLSTWQHYMGLIIIACVIDR